MLSGYIEGVESTQSNRLQVRRSAILESLKHRNIVQLVQKIKDPKKEQIYIVMEVSYDCISGSCQLILAVLHFRRSWQNHPESSTYRSTDT